MMPNKREAVPISYRVLLLGVFLTPFTRVLLIPGVGFSIGDLILIIGCALTLMDSRRVPNYNADALRVFLVPGLLIVLATLISALVNVRSRGFDTAALATQYTLTLIVLPTVMTRLNGLELTALAKAFAYGVAASVFLGLTIITFIPGLESTLRGLGYLFQVGNGRQGLFSGIGELSKMSSMTIPIVYWLVRHGRMKKLKAVATLVAVAMAIIVTRSASGFLTAVATAFTIAILHLVLRDKSQGVNGGGSSIQVMGLLAASAAGTAYIVSQFERLGFSYATDFTSRVTDPLSSGTLESVGSTQVRFTLISEAWAVIGKSPILGTGPGLYLENSQYGQGVHVVPLMLWAETGVAAMAGWVLLMLGALRLMTKHAKLRPTGTVAGLAVVIGIVASHISAPYMYGRALFLPLLLAIFLLVIPEGQVDIQVGDAAKVRPQRGEQGANQPEQGARNETSD